MHHLLILITLLLVSCTSINPNQAQQMQDRLGSIQESVREQNAAREEMLALQKSPVSVEVTKVVDGDTLKVRLGSGEEEYVRIIGIDAPEVEGGCYAEEATARLKELIGGRTVQLLPKPVEDRDEYGRLLRYVETSADVGAVLVREGFAESYEWFTHPRVGEYEELEREAKAEGRGMWGECPS